MHLKFLVSQKYVPKQFLVRGRKGLVVPFLCVRSKRPINIEVRIEKVVSEVIISPKLHTVTAFSKSNNKGKKRQTLCIDRFNE